ncbi:uncharacterized protein LOC143890999 [Tasmannia lanceolata]|uniref:uncharacterized protein LOC143890999 n=1 Tax=Tasmannia lanceolata TaxID=3420 RepID=UPI0040630BC2
MSSPTTIKEIQRLTGRITALVRFISKSVEKCLPFFKALKGVKNSLWTQECQTAFDELKVYLTSPHLLSKPEPGEQLILYLSITANTLAVVLAQEDSGQQKPVYYVSRILHDAELRYHRIEKIAYTLVMVARKLRPYFQSHTIDVLTNQTLRQILHKPYSSGILVKLSVVLGEFDIRYKPRPAIKAQVLADFLVECSIPNEPIGRQEPTTEGEAPNSQGSNSERETSPTDNSDCGKEAGPIVEQLGDPQWNLFVDGSSNEQGSGAGLILTDPDGLSVEYALRFCFKASNNEVEYEALIAGMRLALEVGADDLRAHNDSQLIVNQVIGEYKAREPRMSKYLDKVKLLAMTFKRFEIIKVPRTENAKADALSRLASLGYTNLGAVYIEVLKKASIDLKEEIVL